MAPSAGSYFLGVVSLAVVALALGFGAVRLRRRLLPDWEGAPAHLVDAVLGVALVLWLAQLLGTAGLLYAWALIATSLLLAAAAAWLLPGTNGAAATPRTGETPLPGGGADLGDHPEEQPHRGGDGAKSATGPAGPSAWSLAIAIGVVAVVFAHWGLTAKDALDRGIFNFDSLWYHMPFAVEMVQGHSVTGLHHTETVFTNWFYPQSSELLHAVAVLLTGRDTLSLFLNFGWLAVAFLAAYCIGRPYGRGPLTVVAAGVVLECHTLVVREPGAAKNDLMAAALVLAAIAILVNVRAQAPGLRARARAQAGAPRVPPAEAATVPVGWGLAAAGLATGMAVGTKSTALAIAAALTLAIVVLAPTGRRWAAAGWWFAAGLIGGGYWYVRNLVIAGNPLPQLESIGPISLPHPERLQSGRPDFSIAHYATDTGVWREYFAPGLENAFGILWPVVVGGALAGALLALLRGGDRVVRWMGVVALFGLLAYLFTPLSAAGAEGAPVGFGINLRYAVPALLAGIVLLPLAVASRGQGAWFWGLCAVLVGVLVVTDRADSVLRDPNRLFAWALALLFVLVPAGLLFWRDRGAPRRAIAAGLAILAIAVLAIGYPLQRDYLSDRFAPGSDTPDMDLNSAYHWARDVGDARIGLAGTTAGFLQYGFYGADLSNRVRYLGVEGPHGAFNAISDCRRFRAAVNAAELDYLVTAPFLNFIHPGEPVASPEASWLRGESGVEPVEREGPVTVWRVRGRLNPAACGPRNAPLRRIPQQPIS